MNTERATIARFRRPPKTPKSRLEAEAKAEFAKGK
jgi:hypothetical protein